MYFLSILPVVEAGDVTTASDAVVCCMSVAAIALLVVLLVVVLLELTSHVMVLRISLFEKLLLVMDWLEAEDVAVDDDVLVQYEATEVDHDRMARQWMTGRTSRQNTGWYSTSLHFWQTWAKIALSFWLGKRLKKPYKNLLSCHNSSQVVNL